MARGFILYRDPTAEEEIAFNRDYFAAVANPDPSVGAEVTAVLYQYGKELVTGGREIEVPEGVDPVKAILQFGSRYVIQVAQRAFLVPRQRIDLGKPASLRAATSAASSAPSTETGASTSKT
jgi:hypothetical protein